MICTFCEIDQKNIIHSTDNFIAINEQIENNCILIIPKNHSRSFSSMTTFDDKEISHLIKLIKNQFDLLDPKPYSYSIEFNDNVESIFHTNIRISAKYLRVYRR